MSWLERNITAMDAAVPQTAARVRCAESHTFIATRGADGTPTWSRPVAGPHATRRIEWLGGTSMPAASAAAIVASLDSFSNGANGLGLSIGSGFEWLAFESRLGRAQMLFVYEPDVTLLRLALDICDMADLLAARRIVLLSGSAAEAAEELTDFLRRHPGIEPPTVLHPLTSLTGERKNQLLAAGEAVVRRAVTQRHALVEKLSVELAALLSANTGAGEWAAFLLSPRYPGERATQDEARRRGGPRLALDTHDSAALALRLQTLIDAARAGVPRVLSDLFRGQLSPLPAAIPVETWVPAMVGPAFWERVPPPQTFAPHDRIVVHNAYYLERLKAHGIHAAQIIMRPLQPAAAPTAGEQAWSLRHRAALIADLPATDAQTLGIVLPTHQAVFAAAAALVKADFLTVHPGMAADILRRALLRAGVDLRVDDPALREPMLRVIRDVLIPALPLLELAGTLAAEGIPLLLIGDWRGIDRHIASAALPDVARPRHVPFAAYTPAAWRDAALLATLSPEGAVHPFLWHAVAAGVPVVAPHHRHDATLTELLVAEEQCAHPTAQQLVPVIRTLLRDGARREKLARAAAQNLPHRRSAAGGEN